MSVIALHERLTLNIITIVGVSPTEKLYQCKCDETPHIESGSVRHLTILESRHISRVAATQLVRAGTLQQRISARRRAECHQTRNGELGAVNTNKYIAIYTLQTVQSILEHYVTKINRKLIED